jgi:predicted ATP-grasp superfamily ATP-dependent carboligase
VKILAQNREILQKHYVLTTPRWDNVRFLYDKRLTHSLSIEQGVPVPETHYNTNGPDDLASLKLDFPVILKPAITTPFVSVTKKKAYRADDMEELVSSYQAMSKIINPQDILIQELIPGRTTNLYSFAGFFRKGEPLAGFSVRRHRQHPMEFGRASTFVETVRSPELKALAVRFLQAISYTGLAEVEFMYNPRQHRYELLEVNPRLWGWHTIAIRAGVDLPYLAYTEALGREHVVGSFRETVKWIRLLTDIPTAAIEVLHGRLTVRDWFHSMRGEKEFAVFSLSDPIPFIMEVFLLPYYGSSRGF